MHFCPGLLRHVAKDVLQEVVVGLAVRAVRQDGGPFKAVGLDVDPHGVPEHLRHLADLATPVSEDPVKATTS